MEHLRNILGHIQRKFTICERVYISIMTIILSYGMGLYILLWIARYVKRLISSFQVNSCIYDKNRLPNFGEATRQQGFVFLYEKTSYSGGQPVQGI